MPTWKDLHNLCIHLGSPSPSGRTQPAVSPRGKSIGQRFMGNMMDNLLVRSLTSKSKGRADDIAPPSPVKVCACSFWLLWFGHLHINKYLTTHSHKKYYLLVTFIWYCVSFCFGPSHERCWLFGNTFYVKLWYISPFATRTCYSIAVTCDSQLYVLSLVISVFISNNL